jgi:hypothetical protein
MKSLRTALCIGLFAAFAAGATAYAFDNAAEKSNLDQADASHAAARTDYLLLAQAERNACLNSCQDKNKSCMAQIAPECNSRGCNNERNACTIQYNECAKSCPTR